MIALSCDGVGLAFGVEVVLEDISFSINEGDKLGVVGVNGAGKSSLFKIITGEYRSASTGSVYISKDKTIGYLDQLVAFDSDATLISEMYKSFDGLIAEEAQLAQLQKRIDAGETDVVGQFTALQDKFTREGGYEFRGRCEGILKHLGFDERFWNLRISSLSGGQKTRVALARLLTREPDILMLDEPTNHLDMSTLFWLENYLKNYRHTVIVVSHDRYFLDVMTNKILDVENHRAKLYNGNYSKYVAQKAADREIQARHYEAQQREIARIEAMIEQQRRWGQERNFVTIRSKEKQLEHMTKIDAPDKLPSAVRMSFTKSGESGNDVLDVRGLSKAYPGRPLFEDADFLIKKNDRAFILGDNGCGKSSLIKILAGKDRPDRGVAVWGSNVVVGYYDQENQMLHDDKTVLDELWDPNGSLTETEVRNALALFLFRGDDIRKPVSVLSGGERARLTLAKLLLQQMNVLLLDEPTNHLDINSREALEDALSRFDGTIIAVSHDRYFINKLSTRILDFGARKKYEIFDYHGPFAEYIDYRDRYLTPERESGNARTVSAAREKYLSAKKEISDRRRHENRIKRTAAEIKRLEDEIASLDAVINGEAATDAKRLGDLYTRKTADEDQLLSLYGTMEELEKTDAEDGGN